MDEAVPTNSLMVKFYLQVVPLEISVQVAFHFTCVSINVGGLENPRGVEIV
jgi:hypothetical protein